MFRVPKKRFLLLYIVSKMDDYEDTTLESTFLNPEGPEPDFSSIASIDVGEFGIPESISDVESEGERRPKALTMEEELANIQRELETATPSTTISVSPLPFDEPSSPTEPFPEEEEHSELQDISERLFAGDIPRSDREAIISRLKNLNKPLGETKEKRKKIRKEQDVNLGESFFQEELPKQSDGEVPLRIETVTAGEIDFLLIPKSDVYESEIGTHATEILLSQFIL